MPSFPASLPPLSDSTQFNARSGDDLLRTNMDAGPAKVRRRTTAAPKPRQMGSQHYTRAQVNALLAWRADDLAGGALSFAMTDPMSGTTETFRFVSPISYQPRSAFKFVVTAELERLS